MKLFSLSSLLTAAALAATPAWGQECSSCTPCAPAYRIQYKTIYETQPVTTYRWQVENVLEERQVTSYRGEWIPETRARPIRVAKPVLETSTREERQVVLKPIYETMEEERAYDKTTYVNETATRQERYLVSKPVVETVMQEQRHVVRKAVNETVMQQSQAMAYEPVTTYRTDYVDQGGFVDQAAYVPGTTRNRLSWVPSGYATDANTGLVFRHRAGLHCVPFQSPGAVVTQRVYVPNVVAQQVAQTNYVGKVITQETPVNVTRYVDEVVSQQVPVQTTRYEQVEEVREVPFTVQKPVVERIVEKVPVQHLRWERQELVRDVQVTTQRIEYEDREEEYQVQVYKVVPEIRTIQVPRAEGKWVATEGTRTVARVVAMRVPYGSEVIDTPVIETRRTVVERPVIETRRTVVERPLVEDPITLPPVLKRGTLKPTEARPLEKVESGPWRPAPEKVGNPADEKPAIDPDLNPAGPT